MLTMEQVYHIKNMKKPVKRTISTHSVDGPNQVWMWYITYCGASTNAVDGAGRGVRELLVI